MRGRKGRGKREELWDGIFFRQGCGRDSRGQGLIQDFLLGEILASGSISGRDIGFCIMFWSVSCVCVLVFDCTNTH